MSRAATLGEVPDGITHVAFADESGYLSGRYRSLSLVSLPVQHLTAVRGALEERSASSNVSELKWTKVTGARYRFAALKAAEFACCEASAGKLRVDVLVWDIEDSRNSIIGRNDIANLHRMYHHLLKNVMRSRWSHQARWLLYPDENNAMNWESVQFYAENAAFETRVETDLFEPDGSIKSGGIRLFLRQNYSIHDIIPCDSKHEPLVQLADLFAGISVFSREKFDLYSEWLAKAGTPLFEGAARNAKLSGSDKERFELLRCFCDHTKSLKLGVGCKSSQGLKTHNPKHPINFWFYQPQTELDKAPTGGFD